MESMVNKIGVMSKIDQWICDNDKIQEYLDAPEQRRKLATSIKDYYKKRNQSIPDEIVDKSVEDWFSGRLRIKPAKPNRFETSFIKKHSL